MILNNGESIVLVLSGAPATTNPDFTSAYADQAVAGTGAITHGNSDGTLNGTTEVTGVSGPASGYRRVIHTITISNTDSGFLTVYIKKAIGGTRRRMFVATLDVDETLIYSYRSGLQVYAADGTIRSAGATGAAAVTPTGTGLAHITAGVLDGAAHLLLNSDVDAAAAIDLTKLASITANGRSLVSAANYAAMRTLLSLVPGTDVQAYDAELAAIAALTSAADKGIYFTGAGTAGTFDLTAAALTVLDDTTVAAMVDTLGGASSTGSGGLVRATSPTLVTPVLGTPASGTLTNCTGLPLAGLVNATAQKKLILRKTAGAGAWEEGGLSATLTLDGSGNIDVASNGITDAMLRQSAACTLVGRSANSSGNVADIQLTTNCDIPMRRSNAIVRNPFIHVHTLHFNTTGNPAAGIGIRGCLQSTDESSAIKVPTGKTLKVLTARGCLKSGSTVGTYTLEVALRNSTDSTYTTLASVSVAASTVGYATADGNADNPLATLAAGKTFSAAFFNNAGSPGAMDATFRHNVVITYFFE